MSLLSALIIIPVLYLLYQWKYGRRIELFSRIPSPKKKFLIGNSMDFIGKTMEDYFEQFQNWHRDLGEVFHMTFHPFSCGFIFVTDPKIAEAVSVHQPDRSRCLFYQSLSRWIGLDGFFLLPDTKAKIRLKHVANVYNPKFYEKASLK